VVSPALDTLWRISVVSIRTGKRLTWLQNASDLDINRVVGQYSTLSFKLPTADPKTDILQELSTGIIAERLNPRDPYESGRFRRKVLFGGIVLDSNIEGTDSGNPSTAFLCVGPSYKLWHRFARGRTEAEDIAGDWRQERGIRIPSPEPRAEIMCDLINYAGTIDPMLMRAIKTNQGASEDFAVERWGGPKFLGQLLDEITKTSDGIDWIEQPTYDIIDGRLILADFYAATVLGSDRTGVRLQYGTGKLNCTDASYHRKGETFANSVMHAAAGLDPVTDTAPTITDNGLWEDSVEADIQDDYMRRQLTKYHIALRGQAPRQLATFTPGRSDRSGIEQHPVTGCDVEHAPIPGIDYDVGDSILCEASWDGRILTVSTVMRVLGMHIKYDALGRETADIDFAGD
jgi:hypothetical protein